ncbi:MAG TPA: Ig-like domain-containing protein [Longimicrobium sp.]|nr:Ig-like domain-containing protein [Longimicrobium sp.]
MIPIPTLRRGAAALLLGLSAAACSERGGEPLAPEPGSPPRTSVVLATLECRVDVPANTATCREVPSLGGARGIIVGVGGGQAYSTTTNTRTVADTTLMDVSVTSTIRQKLGTTDGVTPSPTAVRLFITSIAVTSGSGTVTSVRHDGTLNLTGSDQPYYLYDGARLGSNGILDYNETSSTKTWGFRKAPTVNSFVYGVQLLADVQYPNGWIDVAPTPAAVSPGATRTLTPTVRSVLGSVMTETVSWSSSNPAVATVDAAGVVTGVAAGTATITASSGGGVRTSTTTAVVCPVLAVGGVYVTSGPATHLCLGGAGAEYTVVTQNLDPAAMPLSILGTGIGSVSGPPTPNLLPEARRTGLSGGGSMVDGGVEAVIRQNEAQTLTPLIPQAREANGGSSASRARLALVPGTPAVGDLMTIDAATGACTGSDPRPGRVKAVGTRVVVIADTTNPAGGLSNADYADIASLFDSLVWPALATPFGAPTDVDANGDRVVIFYTRALNALSASGAAPVAGLTLTRDLFSTSLCPNSNEGELIYMMAADPLGTINGNARSVAQVKGLAGRTMGHHLQHLINASRRLYVNSAPVFEEGWLDEGLSDVAEELLFYAAAGLSPRSNIGFTQVNATTARRDAFLAYAEPNFARLRASLRAPHVTSDPVAGRGGAWILLRYTADRVGGTESAFWNGLVNSTTSGSANLNAVAGVFSGILSRDAVGALYADDAITGVPATWTIPSWNGRSLYDSLDYDGNLLGDGYPLLAADLANNVARAVTLGAGGGVAYTRLGVDASGTATLAFTVNGAAPGAGMRMVVIRRK